MKTFNIISVVSLLIGTAALILSVVLMRQNKTAASALTATQVEAIVNKAISKTLTANGSQSKNATCVVGKGKLDDAVAKRVSQELDNVDLKELVDKNVEKKLKKAYSAASGHESQNTEVDVSGIADTEGKIKRILEEFEGVSSYLRDNKLVKQMAAMGDEAIEPLIKELISYGNDHSNWTKRMAVDEALRKLLTKDKKEIILENFEKNGVLIDLIKKYNLTEAEDTVFKRIKDDEMAAIPSSIEGYFDAALQMNKARAITAMLDYVSSSDENFAKLYPLKKLTEMGIDVTEPLKQMAANLGPDGWGRSQVSSLMLENGVPEGLSMAISTLRSTAEDSDFFKQRLVDTVRLLTDAKGGDKEMADWLEAHKNTLKWNPSTKRFE